MATEQDKLNETVFQQKSFQDDKLEFCKAVYRESWDRVDSLKDINVENQNMYEGRDDILEQRDKDPRVVRSTLFVHELTPAIDTRIGEAVSKAEERERTVTLRAEERNPDKMVKDDIAYCETKLNQQLRDSGYLTDVFTEHARAAEIYRTPSTVKVGWSERSVRRPVVEDQNMTIYERMVALVRGQDIPAPKVKYETVVEGRPYVEWLHSHEFLYQPNVSRFQEDSVYAIHATLKTKAEVFQYAKDFDCDMEKVEAFFEDMEAATSESSTHTTVAEEVQSDRGTPDKKITKHEKFVIGEFWVLTYDDNGYERIEIAVTLGSMDSPQTLIKEDDSPYEEIRFPFVPLIVNRLSGTLENYSSIDKAKGMQRLYNDIINSYLDGVTYRIFPPFKAKPTLEFETPPIYGPGRMWYINDPESLQPVVENPGSLPDLPGLLEGIGAKMRHLLEAEDISQGFQAQEYEKATSTQLRVMGAARRSTPRNKLYGQAIVEVAKMFIALNRQFGEDGHRWVHAMEVDVPTLTQHTDPEKEKQDLVLLLSQMGSDPLYATPLGMRKRRNAWESLVRKFDRFEVDNFVPTEDEMDQDLRDRAEAENIQLDLVQETQNAQNTERSVPV